MHKTLFFYFIVLFSFDVLSFPQELSKKEKKIQQEISEIKLPELPEAKDQNQMVSSQDSHVDIKSVKEKKILPNEGKPYFTLSTGLAPFEVSLGILKYFIPQWWGHLELNLTFLPNVPVANYYTATEYYKPYVAFRILTGYSFYTYKKFEMSLIGSFQFAFISSTDIPFIPTLGFRFIIDFFWLDLGVGYAVTISSQEQIFKGVYPAITIGFRF